MIVEIDGLRINYKVSGNGKNIILLHGWGGQIISFKLVHEYLEKHFKTYSIDLPGFGESDMPSVPWGVNEYADLINKFIQKLNIDEPILLGHSFGGRICLYLASEYLININKVILVNSAGIKPKRGIKYYFKVYTYKAVRKTLSLPLINKYTKNMIERARNKFGSSDYNNAPEIMKKTMIKVVNEDLKSLLPKIKSPVLLIWGENDTTTPVSDAKIMKKLIPDAGLVVFKNAGHFSYIDKLNDFLIVLNSFLKEDMVKKDE